MKKLFVLIAVVVCSIEIAYSQIDDNSNFVYFFSDSVKYTRVNAFVSPFFKESYLKGDSIKIKAGLVKFYKNETGFYANTMHLNKEIPSFCQMIVKGNINLYETGPKGSGKRVSPQASPNIATGEMAVGVTTPISRGAGIYYYNIGYEDIRKATYQNLKYDLAGNPASMMHLKNYKTAKTCQIVFGVIAATAFASGAYMLYTEVRDVPETGERKHPDVGVSLGLLSLGGGFSWGSYSYGASKPKHIKKAIERYNE